MSRGGKNITRRSVQPDPLYKNILISKFINRIMQSGKKTVAQRAFYDALEIIREKGQDPVVVFERAIEQVGPRQEVRSRRIGGAAYQIPAEVRGERKTSLAIRWILIAATKRSSRDYHTFAEKLAAEFLDAYNNLGEAVKKRDMAQRMADANKAFAHFRW